MVMQFTEISSMVHKVQLPPQHTTLHKFKHKISEIFFHDNHLYMFKNKTLCTKVVLCLQYLFPILEWGPNYNLSLFQHDVISGLTIATLAIPQVTNINSSTFFLLHVNQPIKLSISSVLQYMSLYVS
ncbi:putative SLC26A/SulP transporter [Lupinus albus]|uniref:Putative SLC26A/SulP transporter n=1 Tax=Lupinus albus TaxID=3870 RepID=A0A6A4R6K9_LUPAL|nr:putative SLC26A/SulP transporter [Lupinus albus]